VHGGGWRVNPPGCHKQQRGQRPCKSHTDHQPSYRG
jgi:hypothetical protein